MALLAIAAATLTPGSGPPSRAFDTCLWCGDRVGLDFFYNVLLFVPLALALRRTGVERRPVLALGVALSVLVEVLQLGIIPGRYSSLRDILANSLGAVFGVLLAEHGAGLRDPSPIRARTLVLVGAATLILANCVTAWLLGPSLPESPWWTQFAPRHRLYSDYFRGSVTSVRLATSKLAASERVDEATVSVVRAEPEIACQLAAEIISGAPTSGVAPIAAIADEHNHVLTLLAQVGEGAMYRIRMRAADFGLTTPAVYIDSALPPPGSTARLKGEMRYGFISVGVQTSAGEVRSSLRLSSSWIWKLLLPETIYLSTTVTRTITALWLATLVFVLGFWSVQAATRRDTRVLQALIAVAVFCALALVPSALGVPVSDWGEWLACVAGFLGGISLGNSVSRKSPRRVAKIVRRWSAPLAASSVGASSSRR